MHAVSDRCASADSFLAIQHYYSNKILPQLFTLPKKDFPMEVSMQWEQGCFPKQENSREQISP